MTKIDIISGFLGAGKTTLIKKLLSEALKGEQVVLIENEFGEIGIDGGFLLDIGLTRVDCSVMALINQVRPSLEADVCRILFDSSRKDKENG